MSGIEEATSYTKSDFTTRQCVAKSTSWASVGLQMCKNFQSFQLRHLQFLQVVSTNANLIMAKCQLYPQSYDYGVSGLKYFEIPRL